MTALFRCPAHLLQPPATLLSALYKSCENCAAFIDSINKLPVFSQINSKNLKYPS